MDGAIRAEKVVGQSEEKMDALDAQGQ